MKSQSKTKSQSELEFEKEVILYLTKIGGVKQWEYKEDIKTTEQLWDNFKIILEQNNQARLNNPLSITEFNQVKKIIYTSDTVFVTDKDGSTLVGANGMKAKDDFSEYIFYNNSGDINAKKIPEAGR